MQTDITKSILKILSEQGGLLSGDVSKQLAPDHANRRVHSSWVRTQLLQLKLLDLVDFLDGKKPVCWIRTKRGTALVDEASK